MQQDQPRGECFPLPSDSISLPSSSSSSSPTRPTTTFSERIIVVQALPRSIAVHCASTVLVGRESIAQWTSVCSSLCSVSVDSFPSVQGLETLRVWCHGSHGIECDQLFSLFYQSVDRLALLLTAALHACAPSQAMLTFLVAPGTHASSNSPALPSGRRRLHTLRPGSVTV
ncbi:hypothetical protein Ae201684P_019417 [Aphanomyces euteiches]|nr:hypothetical protein Ae201684P_019417 [Aphanomyces euteiches]